MDSHEVLLAATYLLGTLAAFCLGQSGRGGLDIQVMLSGSNSKCQGQVEIQIENKWKTVCSSSWRLSQDHSKNAQQASAVCKQLRCGDPLALGPFPSLNRPQNQVFCQGSPWSISNCNNTSSQDQCLPLSLICLEPQRTTPPPTTTPPTTVPEPTAPPRLQLVPGHEGLRCTGVVEFYNGSWGGTILYKAKDRPLPIRWEAPNGSCVSLQQCFQKTTAQEGGQALTVICSDFQPKVQSRLVGGSSVCEGIAEVRQRSQWEALCDSSAARGRGRWEELCREQQCGDLISFHTVDADKTSPGFLCAQEKLSQCYHLQKKKHCNKRVFVTCQDPNPAGLAPGTVASIILTLVLLVVLLAMCGPLVYKKLVKKSPHTPSLPSGLMSFLSVAQFVRKSSVSGLAPQE